MALFLTATLSQALSTRKAFWIGQSLRIYSGDSTETSIRLFFIDITITNIHVTKFCPTMRTFAK